MSRIRVIVQWLTGKIFTYDCIDLDTAKENIKQDKTNTKVIRSLIIITKDKK